MDSESHATSSMKGALRSGGTVCPVQLGYRLWASGGLVVAAPPPTSRLPPKQSVGPGSRLPAPMSPLVGLPKNPLCEYVLPMTASPYSSNRHAAGVRVPPVHGAPLSGYGTRMVPHAPLLAKTV